MSRGETFRYLQVYIIRLSMVVIKKILRLERVFPRAKCPFCPVIFVFEPPNSLASKMLGIVRFKPMAGFIGKIN